MDITTIIKYLKTDTGILRKTIGPDEWGNPKETWPSIATVKGLLRQTAEQERFASNKDTPIGEYRLYCLPTSVTTSDRLTYKNKTYSIIRVNDVMDMGVLYQVDCNRYGT